MFIDERGWSLISLRNNIPIHLQEQWLQTIFNLATNKSEPAPQTAKRSEIAKQKDSKLPQTDQQLQLTYYAPATLRSVAAAAKDKLDDVAVMFYGIKLPMWFEPASKHSHKSSIGAILCRR